MIKQSIGQQSTEPRLATYHDLDHLAGTWTAEAAAVFAEVAQDFELVGWARPTFGDGARGQVGHAHPTQLQQPIPGGAP